MRNGYLYNGFGFSLAKDVTKTQLPRAMLGVSMSGNKIAPHMPAYRLYPETLHETRPASDSKGMPLAEATLARSTCPTCQVLVMQTANFCHNCGSRLGVRALVGNTDLSLHAERRRVTIVFCDLVNSVALSAGRDPEDIAEAMGHYYGSLTAVMTKFGGNWERPIGDGALFYFGYPVAGEDDAERAVAAALEAVEAIGTIPLQFGTQLQLRIGISTGEVVIGDLLSDPTRRTHDVVGDVANLAARLQMVALPGCVLVSDPVRELTCNSFDYEDLGRLQLRGWADAMQLWRAVRRVRTGGRFASRIAACSTPIIGRTEELAALGSIWEHARSGSGRAVLLTGQPGIGKSRLVHELTKKAKCRGGLDRSVCLLADAAGSAAASSDRAAC